MNKRRKRNPARISLLIFLALILAGATLLVLPISSRDGMSKPFLTALFTSASAVCVTGLTVVDTAQAWSLFGQIVILVLFQVGALGIMSVAAVFFFIMNKKINLSERLLIMQSLSLHDRQGVVRLIRHVLIGTLIFEGVGAVILWTRFAPDYGLWQGLGMGVFHSVSAFCNAGFDLMGSGGLVGSSGLMGSGDLIGSSGLIGSGGQSIGLSAYSGDAVFSITVMLLIILGGLGFFVWEDIWLNRRFRNLHLHSKLVLVITLGLILFGWVFFYFAERTNPATIGSMPFPEAALSALFQSITPRSGGLSVINQASLTNVSRLMVLLFMLIGGSAGSAAGGIKNVTAGILFLSAVRSLRGKSGISVFGRNVPDSQVVSALSIAFFVLTACVMGIVVISFIQPELSTVDVVFEVVSAVATCGLSQGITASLAPASRIVIIVLMFLGRIGIMTVGMAAVLRRNAAEKTKHPDTWVMM